jgi:DNA-3-methyladenine glycosylase
MKKQDNPSPCPLPQGERIRRDFFVRRTLTVARDLIGMHLVRAYRGKQLIGRIVETEAYQGPEDKAAHSARGKTERNAVMYGPPGHAYVYLIYGMWDCVNIVTREQGIPHAVLIRAVEPIAQIPGKTWGPGLLCKAMYIDRTLNGADLCMPLSAQTLWVESPEVMGRRKIVSAPRIGVDYAGDWAHKRWRFFDQASPYVSTRSDAQRRRLLGSGRWALERAKE